MWEWLIGWLLLEHALTKKQTPGLYQDWEASQQTCVLRDNAETTEPPWSGPQESFLTNPTYLFIQQLFNEDLLCAGALD